MTEEEICAAARQFVRKISGMNRPSRQNEAVFEAAIEEIAAAAGKLLGGLETKAVAKVRTPRPGGVAGA